MPPGGQYQYFDFQNDSPYQVAIVFGNDTQAESTDIDMLPNTIVERVVAPTNSAYTVNGLWASGPLFVYVSLPPGGTVSASQAPAQVLTIIGHAQGYQYPFTIALNRFQGVSNPSLNTNGGNVASSVSNINQINSSPVVTASPLGDTQNTVTLDNIGNLTIGDTMHPGSTSLANGTFKIDGSGNVTNVVNMDSTGSLRFYNTTGTARVLASLNQFSNNNTLFCNVDNQKIDFDDSNGNYIGGWDGNLATWIIENILQINCTPTVTAGTTAGTVSVYTPISGAGLTVCYIRVVSYNNTTAPQQTFSLPLFTTGALAIIGGITTPLTSGCYFKLNGTLVQTAMAKFGSAVVIGTGRNQSMSVGEINDSFNQITFDGLLTGIATGSIILIGV